MDQQHIRERITSFFPELNEEDIDVFLSITEYKFFKNNDLILDHDRDNKLAFLILKGSARAYSFKGETEINEHYATEGDVFGDPRILGGQPVILKIAAMGDTHVLILDMGEFEELGFKHPNLMRIYLNILKGVIIALTWRVHSFVSMTSKERYISLINSNRTYLKSAFDKQIARFLGITPLTLHRIKKEIINK